MIRQTILALALATAAQASLVLTNGTFTGLADGSGYSVQQTSIAAGNEAAFDLNPLPGADGLVVVSLLFSGDGHTAWTDPVTGYTGADQLAFGIGDVMAVKVPTNVSPGVTIEAVALITTAAHYVTAAEIAADPAVRAFSEIVAINTFRPRVQNSGVEATVGNLHPDGSIGCDFDTDWGTPAKPVVPEPSTAMLLILAAGLLFRR